MCRPGFCPPYGGEHLEQPVADLPLENKYMPGTVTGQVKFKRTETPPAAGIPEGWGTLRLGDVCQKIGSGATPRGGNGVYLAQGISLIRSQNVYNNRFEHDGLAFIGDDHAEQLKNVVVEQDDVLLNITGDSVARACQVPQGVLPARVNQHVAIIRPRKDMLDPQYLKYYLVSPEMQSYMLGLSAVGATRNALTKGMIESFEIPAPSIDEQRNIARILGALDAKIDLNRRMNETLEHIARAIFKRWFIDFEFPGHEKARFVDGLPEGWRSGTLGEIADNPRRGIDPERIVMSTPYIGLEHMPRRCISLSDWGCADDLESNKFTFKRGEILFGKLRPYFHKVGIAPIDGVCSTDILVVVPKAPEWFGLVFSQVISDDFINYATATSTGTKMPRTNWQDMARYEIALPPKVVAVDFTAEIQSLIDKITTNIHESRVLSNIRDTLLPKLMSGEIRA